MGDDLSSAGPKPEGAGTAAQPLATFQGHGFWTYHIASHRFTWSDGLLRADGPVEFDAASQGFIWDALHPEDRDGFGALLQRVAASGAGDTLVVRLRCADGSWRVVSNHVVAEKNARGRVIGIQGIVLDITEIEICRLLAEQGNDIISQTDAAGVITFISASVEKVVGHAPAELIGRSVADVLGRDAAVALQRAVKAALRDPAAGAQLVEYETRHKDGRTIWLESRAIPMRDEVTGALVGVTDVIRDVTARKAAEDKLARANILLNTLMESSPSGIIMVDDDDRISAFNHTFAEMWGIPTEVLELGAPGPVMDLAATKVKDPAEMRRGVGELTRRTDEPSWDEIEAADGRWIDRYTVPVRAPDQGYMGRAWFFRDVTEHKRALAEAVRMSRFDDLTGLANRSVMLEALERAVTRARRGEASFALFYLDLDHFKDVNDTLGHLFGDRLLLAVAERLRAHCGRDALLARLGGDEFAILLEVADAERDAPAFAEALLRLTDAPFPIEDEPIHTSFSVGIDVFARAAPDAPTLLSHADMALYQAKFGGAGSYSLFSEEMDISVRTRVSLASELREALASDQLFLMYQPGVNLSNGAIVGMEALVRWRHPTRGVLGPDLFIPVAEQMGLIQPLGRWVLHEATRQMREWADQGLPKIRMGVNVSALQFKSPEALEADIESALAQSGLRPWSLELELTESALMTAAEAGDILARLHRTGVRIAIDDFGTGYSSLDYLRRLPAHRIKIAQTFVRHLDSSPGDAAIVKATIGLARDLGMSVIAEGVETEAQLRRLLDWGCGECQGYYFDRPLAAEDAALRLQRGGYGDGGAAEAA